MPSTIELAEAGIWIAGHARTKVPAGVELRLDEDGYAIILAGPEFNDSLVFSGTYDDDGVALLRRALDSNDGIQLVAASLPELAANLAYLTGLPTEVVADRIIGDTDTIEYVIGPDFDAYSYTNPVEITRAAVRRWQAAQQMLLPSYYEKVAVPLTRSSVQGVPEGQGFDLQYSHLFLRVVAKYSADPSILRAINDGEVPHHYIAKNLRTIYDQADHDFAFACVVWSALGGDTEYLGEAHPQILERLDGLDMGALTTNLNKVLPSIQLMAQNLWGAGTGSFGPVRSFQTLYGRSRPFIGVGGPGPYLDFVLGGTVEDLRNVAAVTTMNLGAKLNAVLTLEDDPLSPRHRIVGILPEGDPYQFLSQLKEVAGLGGPLAPVPLQPVAGLE